VTTLAAIGLGILYWPTFEWLVWIWINDRSYSHGFVVPLISGYLVWIKREQLKSLALNPATVSGAIVVVMSCVFLFVGRVGVFVQLEALSLLCILPGIIIFVLGWAHLKALILPLAYLQFMVPWLDELISYVHKPFQLISAWIGAGILKGAGFTLFREGIYIELPGLTLKVAEECSGINFVISILAIGIPLVYLTQRDWWRGCAVLFMGVVITVLTNSVRVALAGVMGHYYGAAMLHGPGHIFRGWFVAQVGIVALFIVNWAVYQFSRDTGPRLCERWKCGGQAAEGGSLNWRVSPQFIALWVILAITASYMYAFALPRPVPLPRPLQSLPMQLGPWHGKDMIWFRGDEHFPGVFGEIQRAYTNPRGEEVYLYIGYFPTQTHERRLISFHGKPLHEKARSVPSGLKGGDPKQVNLSSLKIDGKAYQLLFWYTLPSGGATDRLEAKVMTMEDGLRYRKNNAAVVIFAAPFDDRGHGRDNSERLKSFLDEVGPALDGLIPTGGRAPKGNSER